MNQELQKTPQQLELRSLVGIFDSGVGGLSVLRAIRTTSPELPVLYLADQAHVPYGQRPLEQVKAYAIEISRWLVEQGAELVVVACNTASAAALHSLRQIFPGVPFVGMEPAVKPAAETTRSGKVGVLATPATFQGELYASVVERFANGVTLYQSTCPGLVEKIEGGALDAPETRTIIEDALHPMLKEGIDTIVLGCTHYPFAIPIIQEIAGPHVRVIDPAPAIARQVRRLLSVKELAETCSPMADLSDKQITPGQATQFFTTGSRRDFQRSIQELLGEETQVLPLRWKKDKKLTMIRRG